MKRTKKHEEASCNCTISQHLAASHDLLILEIFKLTGLVRKKRTKHEKDNQSESENSTSPNFKSGIAKEGEEEEEEENRNSEVEKKPISILFLVSSEEVPKKKAISALIHHPDRTLQGTKWFKTNEGTSKVTGIHWDQLVLFWLIHQASFLHLLLITGDTTIGIGTIDLNELKQSENTSFSVPFSRKGKGSHTEFSFDVSNAKAFLRGLFFPGRVLGDVYFLMAQKYYHSFLNLLFSVDKELTILERLCTLGTEEVVSHIIGITLSSHSFVRLIRTLAAREVAAAHQETTLFRVDSSLTKLCRILMMKVGKSYLTSVIEPILEEIVSRSRETEESEVTDEVAEKVMAEAIPPVLSLEAARSFLVSQNRNYLDEICLRLIKSVTNSASILSPEAKCLIALLNYEVSKKFPDFVLITIVAPVFLRFIIPAIVDSSKWTENTALLTMSASHRSFIRKVAKQMMAQVSEVTDNENLSPLKNDFSSFLAEILEKCGLLRDSDIENLFREAAENERIEDHLGPILSQCHVVWEEGAVGTTGGSQEVNQVALKKVKKRVESAIERFEVHKDTESMIELIFRTKFEKAAEEDIPSPPSHELETPSVSASRYSPSPRTFLSASKSPQRTRSTLFSSPKSNPNSAILPRNSSVKFHSPQATTAKTEKTDESFPPSPSLRVSSKKHTKKDKSLSPFVQFSASPENSTLGQDLKLKAFKGKGRPRSRTQESVAKKLGSISIPRSTTPKNIPSLQLSTTLFIPSQSPTESISPPKEKKKESPKKDVETKKNSPKKERPQKLSLNLSSIQKNEEETHQLLPTERFSELLLPPTLQSFASNRLSQKTLTIWKVPEEKKNSGNSAVKIGSGKPETYQISNLMEHFYLFRTSLRHKEPGACTGGGSLSITLEVFDHSNERIFSQAGILHHQQNSHSENMYFDILSCHNPATAVVKALALESEAKHTLFTCSLVIIPEFQKPKNIANQIAKGGKILMEIKMSSEASSRFGMQKMKTAVERNALISDVLERVERRCAGDATAFQLYLPSCRQFCDPNIQVDCYTELDSENPVFMLPEEAEG